MPTKLTRFRFLFLTAAVLLGPPAGAGPLKPVFVDINPDDSGPLPGCAAPCVSGG